MDNLIEFESDFSPESALEQETALSAAIVGHDRSGMLGRLDGFPEQLRRAGTFEPGSFASAGKISAVVFAGLGGSAIAGDLAVDILGRSLGVPAAVIRDYRLPAWVGKGTLVLLLSYSGDTEETVSMFRDALERGAQAAVVSSGGSLGREAAALGLPMVTIPSGYPPRAALGFLFGGALGILKAARLLDSGEDCLNAAVEAAQAAARRCGPGSIFRKNPARRLAACLRGTVPVLYASGPLASTALRWKNQFEENGKNAAFTGVIPEINHNGIVGWENPAPVLDDFSVVFLRDRSESAAVGKRFAVTAALLRPRRCLCMVSARAETFPARVFALIATGDWTSFYLALENGVDPTPVDRITRLKRELSGG